MLITKPPHNKYVFFSTSESSYLKHVKVYALLKCWGIKGLYCYLTGTGMVTVAKEVLKGTVVQYGKRRLALVVVGAATYVCAPAVAVITNATNVVKCCKVVYTGVGYIAEACEDASQLTFLPIDMILFGQPILANNAGRYSSWSNLTDLVAELPLLD
jgi:hypothetical protein